MPFCLQCELTMSEPRGHRYFTGEPPRLHYAAIIIAWSDEPPNCHFQTSIVENRGAIWKMPHGQMQCELRDTMQVRDRYLVMLNAVWDLGEGDEMRDSINTEDWIGASSLA